MERINSMLAEQKRINIEQRRVNEEQKRINDELMAQMKQMQAEIIRLSGGDCGGSMMGSGYAEGFGGGKIGQSFLGGGRSMPYGRGPSMGPGADDFFGSSGSMMGGPGRMGGGGNGIPAKTGDWYCPKCGNLNYDRREQCNMRDCDFEKKDLDDYSSGMGMGGFMPGGTDMGPRGPEPRQGDWDCPKCQNINFSHRNRCNGKSSGVPCNLRKPEFEKFSVPFLRNKEMRQPGDWCCLRCGNINFPSRENCNKCEITKEDATNMEAYRENGKGDF
eukprot:TRINITY_DN2611_c0_g1_i1.p1 TRINITY_DN2611_c0_g1~~TRINITY_DN2611_c0_g1_i1.p1  ORF type:complete len:274 (+),score=98.19 TRINITY_DN2611_c0_g1_i1:60-881(+)